MLNARRSVLAIAHPGHELRVFGWLEQTHPLICVLTVGSRSTNSGRLSATRSIASAVGARAGSLFGRYRDHEIYESLLAHDPSLFMDWTLELAGILIERDADLLVTDGWQMYNVSHDLVHTMSRVAAGRAAAQLGRPIDVVDFNVVPSALCADLPVGKEAFRVDLDSATFERKNAAAAGYRAVQEEFDEIIALEGEEAQRTEVFHSMVGFEAMLPRVPAVPPYEKYGDRRVAAGVYKEVIRWNAHVRPVVDALLAMRSS